MSVKPGVVPEAQAPPPVLSRRHVDWRSQLPSELRSQLRYQQQSASGWLCALLLLLAVLAAHPVAEIGINDDYSYVFMAKTLAGTGRVLYNGWTTPMLGWQLFLGAGLIKVFGFSFGVVRAAITALAALNAVLMYRLMLRFGLPPRSASLGVLTIALSPLYLPLACSFMTDVPGLLCSVVCLYCCVRAVQAQDDGAAVRWIVAATVLNLLGGTVRQVVWLGALVMVPSTAWSLRRRKGMLPAGAACWAASALGCGLMMQWFKHQPYVVVEKLIALPELSARGFAVPLLRACFTVALLLSPVCVAFAARYPWSDARARRALPAALAVLAIAMAAPCLQPGGFAWLHLLLGNYMTAKGLIYFPYLLGDTRGDVLSWPVQALLAFAGLAAVCAAMLCLWFTRARAGRNERDLLKGSVFWLLGPFSAAYLLLLFTRATTFDRYFLPVLLFAVILLGRAYQRRFHAPFAWIAVLPLTLVATFAVMGTHDLFAEHRAVLRAADEIRAAGVARTELRAGFEYDGWTQMETSGRLNDARVTFPAGAFVQWAKPPALPDACVVTFQGHTPDVHARYELAYGDAGGCFAQSELKPVTYETWLPPHMHTIYVLAVPAGMR